MTKHLTKHLSISETYFTETKTGWAQYDLLPFIHIDQSRILMGWLCFTLDFHWESDEMDLES